ncbi:DNA/RNA non-specific endonuclease [Acidovorax sp. D4N7]|uniref:DNA/RNA non-specific endonuclease n=1 Tax=Comamonas endophytica TaxID=2949090 RepID=A0ABY6GB68_9BURK|nr:DNA/RNA non-specific endonuclease [Acidovorax sp. 5MLIR]MCD2512003.1 DNA/RNA non-specific endonuclease [Acidovorax sp. D4N7]UYG51782.1 DNA/RNA non-specific endonuclease [Acidovorax sp. 5MLIR]
MFSKINGLLRMRRFWFGLTSSAAVGHQVSGCTLGSGLYDSMLAKFSGTVAAPLLASVLATLTPLADGLTRYVLHDLLGLPVGTSGSASSSVAGTPSSSATQFSQCRQHFPAGQPPMVPDSSNLRELCYSAFAVLHSGSHKTPVFVAERLNRATIAQAKGRQRTDRFFADARLPRAERAELADYQGSGYSRGHMAPAGDMASAEAMAQSFSLANMVPQNQAHNAGPWSQIEQDTRSYAQRAQGDVYVFTGPVYSGPIKTIGPNKVQVPSHLFKLVYDASTGRSWAHWQANAAGTRMSAPISYEELVRRSGIRFLPG